MRTVYLNAAYFPSVELLSAVATAAILIYGGNQVLRRRQRRDDRRARLVRLLPAELLRPDPAAVAALHDLPGRHGGARQDLRAARRGARPRRPAGRDRAAAPSAARSSFDDVTFSYGTARRPRCATSICTCRRARRSRWSARPAPASRRSRSWSPASTTPTDGRVLIDGHDLRDVTEHSLRSQLGIVPQEGFLFSGTIGDNIAFGRPDATDEEVRAAARAVGAHEFIERLPDGYDTEVGERGGHLSAGQRQLVAFARAAAADPRILILDEATSNVDVHTEAQIEHGPAAPAGRPHGARDRPPPLDDPRRRTHRGAGARRGSSSRAPTTSCSRPTAPTPACIATGRSRRQPRPANGPGAWLQSAVVRCSVRSAEPRLGNGVIGSTPALWTG